jgi:membrane protein
VTSVLFMIGRELIGLYLARISVASTYGAAGSLVVMMIWVYYSAQIFLLGAEFTQVRACRRGAQVEPARGACAMTEAKRQARAAKAKRHGKR